MKNILYSYFLIFSLFTFGFNGMPYASYQITNRAGLVVQFEDDRIETYCIPFNEESISGYEFLKRSELQLECEFSSMGVAVCKIEDVGCPPSECLICEKPKYWAYWHLVDDKIHLNPNQLRHPYQQTLHLFHRQPAFRILATQLHPRPQRWYSIQLKR